jgi:hypothetical protein
MGMLGSNVESLQPDKVVCGGSPRKVLEYRRSVTSETTPDRLDSPFNGDVVMANS